MAPPPKKKGKAIPVTGRGGPYGLCDVEAIGTQMAVRLSALRAGRPLPKEDSWYSFLLEAELTPGP
jgi:hypothetical protein